MSNFRRISNEKKKLDEMNIKYNCYRDENNVMKFIFNSNHGCITIVILSEYPFKPPRLIINTGLNNLQSDSLKYLNKLLFNKLKLKYTDLNNDLFEYISNYYDEINSVYSRNDIEYYKDIHFKKYIYDLINRKTDKSTDDFMYDYDNKFIDYWSPAMNISQVLNNLKKIFSDIGLKEEKKLIFELNS